MPCATVLLSCGATHAQRDDYVEDFRVRRGVIKRLLEYVIQRRHWRTHYEEEHSHSYYVDFDFMSDDELAEVLPEDDVPQGLNMQELDPEHARTDLSGEEFEDWLYEGRHNCDVAQALFHAWSQPHLRATDQDCFNDFPPFGPRSFCRRS